MFGTDWFSRKMYRSIHMKLKKKLNQALIFSAKDIQQYNKQIIKTGILYRGNQSMEIGV